VEAEPRGTETEPARAPEAGGEVARAGAVVPPEQPPFDVVTEAPPVVTVPTPHLEVAPPPLPGAPDGAEVEPVLNVVPVPTLAAPPGPLPRRAEVEPACALVQRGGKVEALYRLPAGVERVLLRVVWFVPGKAGPNEGNLDLVLEPAEDRVALPPVERAAHVRGALGIELEGAFKPLAVAWVYRASDAGLTVEFAPPGVEPAALRDSSQLARAAADSPG
jgi:hypothetical protein